MHFTSSVRDPPLRYLAMAQGVNALSFLQQRFAGIQPRLSGLRKEGVEKEGEGLTPKS